MSASLITCEVDLDADGKQSGYLRIPHSSHRSAYGWIASPITVIGNGEGPTVLMLAGVHGDEYEGQIALGRLARELEPNDIAGRLLILPTANAPAAVAGLRTSPLDGGNLNRVFPGSPTGSPTEMIAHYIEEVLLPRCDFLIDLHSGGTSLFYEPTLLRGLGHSPGETETLLQLQAAFDLPFAWVFTSGGGRSSTARTGMGAANRKGVMPIMAELGGGGAVTPEILEVTWRGLQRCLNSLGMLPAYRPDAPRGTKAFAVEGSVYAYDVGVFEPRKDIGDAVTAGETVGAIHAVETVEAEPVPVISPHSGMVLCKRALGRVVRGDAVFQIASRLE